MKKPNMQDLMHLLKSQSLGLAPFFNSIILYFVFVQDPKGELWDTVLKCVPIFFLMLYILLKGIAFTKEYKCSQRILVGLIFSSVGDALLNVDLFPAGMGAFALAQICYITAFGWKPLKWKVGLGLYVAGAALVAVMFHKLDLVLAIGFPIYAVLLLTMCWRAIARALHQSNFLYMFCAFGSVLFVISDALIAVNMFLTEVPFARVLIMSTYYLAQFAITLSTSTEKIVKTSPKRSKQSIHSRINGAESARRRPKLKD